MSVPAVRDAAIRAGLTLEEFEQCVSLPITKVESAIADKIKLSGGKAAPIVRSFAENLKEAGAVVLSEGYTYLRECKAKTEPVVDV